MKWRQKSTKSAENSARCMAIVHSRSIIIVVSTTCMIHVCVIDIFSCLDINELNQLVSKWDNPKLAITS